MSAPHLTRALVLEQKQQVPDGAGGFTVIWVGLGTVWAEVSPGTGREAAGEEYPLALVPYRITVRAAGMGAPSRPVPGQRFRDGTRRFAILTVSERDEMGQYLLCIAREEEPS